MVRCCCSFQDKRKESAHRDQQEYVVEDQFAEVVAKVSFWGSKRSTGCFFKKSVWSVVLVFFLLNSF